MDIHIDEAMQAVNLVLQPQPNVILGSANLGPQGPQGAPGQWTALTQAEYDALDPPDPEVLYVIV